MASGGRYAVDDDEREEHERLKRVKREAEESLKKSMESMMNGMIEAMAPMMGGSQLLTDEAKAWDEYVCAFVQGRRMQTDEDEVDAIEFADNVLAERRKRFNKEMLTEQMRGFLPSGKNLCNKPVLRNDGTDTGTRCARNVDHPGDAHY